ncbi:DUF6461 domain-containing protein [Dactylosporangium sp. NPDC048998]|uniref:DUF6461 domain-containing protein n=1 Tax=Dactylosporangium sp. NPDC048998 TaxID=3363976 RepID=UPI003711EB21
MEEIARYGWLDESPLGEAACVTFVESMDLVAVAAAFGGSLEEAVDVAFGGSLEEAVDVAFDGDYEPDYAHATVVLRQIGGWVLAIEDNGWQGSRPEVLRRLTEGRAVSCFWNVNAVTRFNYANHGTVVTEFEALFPDDRGGFDPNALEDLRAGLPWDEAIGATQQLMLALAARITGLEFVPDLLAGPMLAVPLRPWPQDVAERVHPRYEPLTQEDPELSYALQQADGPALRSVARLATDRAALAAGMREHPALAAVIAGEEVPPGRLDALARDLDLQGHAPQFRAVEAARACTSPSALAAAFRAITEAGHAVQATRADARALRDALLIELGSPEPPSGSGGLTSATWLDEHWLGWAGCATYIRGMDVTEVTATLGADPATISTGPVTLSTQPLAWTRVVGEWVVVLEPGRRLRPADPLLERLSVRGEAVQAEWNAISNVWFRHAIAGVLRGRRNGYAPEQVCGTDPHALDALVAELPIPRPGADGGGQAIGLLALAAQMTGIELGPSALDERWHAHRIS